MLKRKLLLTSWIAQNLLLVRKVLCRLVLKIISNVCAFKFFFKLLIHLLKILFFHFIDIQHIQMVIYLELVISAIIVPVQQRQRRQHQKHR